MVRLDGYFDSYRYTSGLELAAVGSSKHWSLGQM